MPTADRDIWEQALSAVGIAVLDVLAAMEAVMRALDPPALPTLRAQVAPYEAALADAVARLAAVAPPPDLRDLHERFAAGAALAHRAVALFVRTPAAHEAIAAILESRNVFCRALAHFYGLHRLPPLSRYFVEPAFHDRIEELDPPAPPGVSVGLHRTRLDDDARRGGFSLYVPERYDGTAEWPLVVALHGASGSGEEFLWTWLREARGRRFLLLAPTARGATWSMMGPDVDGPTLHAMVDYVCRNWRVKRESILLTGLSDGGTYALLCGMAAGSPFTALAPVAATLHPAVLGPERAPNIAGRRIYMVHGARDWLFPIAIAHLGRDALREAGADLVFREIEDLSHTYPREENDRILVWFDPTLALP
jgi:phospholipase/carboxylesterase